MIPRVLAKQGWTPGHAILAVLFALGAVAATSLAWRDIGAIASHDPEASHIYLVPVVAIWMIWVRKVRLLRCPPGGGVVGTGIVALGWALSSIGYRYSIQSFWHGGCVLVLVGALVSVLGKHVLFQFFPAFAVLAFVVPVPGQMRQAISVPLQTASAAATHAVLQVLGVEAELNQNLLSVRGTNIEVAEACNGMRMVFALVLVSYAFAFGEPLRGYVRAIIMLLSPIAALACNIPRLVGTVLVYAYAGQGAGDAFHGIAGWAMLPLAFLLLLAITRTLRWALLPVERFTLAYQ